MQSLHYRRGIDWSYAWQVEPRCGTLSGLAKQPCSYRWRQSRWLKSQRVDAGALDGPRTHPSESVGSESRAHRRGRAKVCRYRTVSAS